MAARLTYARKACNYAVSLKKSRVVNGVYVGYSLIICELNFSFSCRKQRVNKTQLVNFQGGGWSLSFVL